MVDDLESDPAWAVSLSGVRLYDGNPFLGVVADVLPGFILLELANRTTVPLLYASCSITPVKKDARVQTRMVALTLPPASRTIVPVAYTCDMSCESSILVTYRRDEKGVAGSRLHVCQARAFLIPMPEGGLFTTLTWRPLIPKMARREMEIPVECGISPLDVLDRLGALLGGRFVSLSGINDSNDSPSWGCIDPIFMITFARAPGSTFTVYGLDGTVLDQVVTGFPNWCNAGRSRKGDLFELGVACTTLRDGLLLRTKTDYMRMAGRQVARLTGILGLQVPSLSFLLDLLVAKESLEELTEQERGIYERALVEVETQVMGRPS